MNASDLRLRSNYFLCNILHKIDHKEWACQIIEAYTANLKNLNKENKRNFFMGNRTEPTNIAIPENGSGVIEATITKNIPNLLRYFSYLPKYLRFK